MHIPREFSFKIRPYKQGIITLLLIVFIMLVMGLLRVLALIKPDPMDIWLYSTAMLLFFILFNSFINFQYKEILMYYRESIFTYAALLVITIASCTLISGINIYEAESYSWIIYVFSLVYIVFITITGLMRKIVSIALKQEDDESKKN